MMNDLPAFLMYRVHPIQMHMVCTLLCFNLVNHNPNPPISFRIIWLALEQSHAETQESKKNKDR